MRRETVIQTISQRKLRLKFTQVVERSRYWMLGAGALGRPRWMVRGGRRDGLRGDLVRGLTGLGSETSRWPQRGPCQGSKGPWIRDLAVASEGTLSGV